MSALGDVIHTLPALATLRKTYPDAFIAWVVEEPFKDLLRNNPDLDEVIVVGLKRWRRNLNLTSLKEFVDFLRKLRRHKFDVLFDFQGLVKSGLIGFLAGVPERIGFQPRDCREPLNALFTTRKIPALGKNVHVVDKNLSLLKPVATGNPIMKFPLQLSPEAEESAGDYFQANPELKSGPVIGIHAGVGFETKRWELNRFAELSDRIANELGCNILLTWGPGEEEQVKALSSKIKHRHWVAPANNLQKSMALFKSLNMLVSCDTGPVHICAAFGVPTVSIHGPTAPDYSRPREPIHEVAVHVLPCSFCHKRTCPTQNECMTSVTVDDVFQIVKKSFSKNVKILGVENPVS